MNGGYDEEKELLYFNDKSYFVLRRFFYERNGKHVDRLH